MKKFQGNLIVLFFTYWLSIQPFPIQASAATVASPEKSLPQVFITVDEAGDANNRATFKWRSLTNTELSSWYTPLDLCTLNSTKRMDFPQDIRANDCREFSHGSR